MLGMSNVKEFSDLRIKNIFNRFENSHRSLMGQDNFQQKGDDTGGEPENKDLDDVFE